MAVLPSLGPSLSSAKAKLTRADKHIRALRYSLNRWGRLNPYSVEAGEFDSQVFKENARAVVDRPLKSMFIDLSAVAPRVRLFGTTIPTTVHLVPKGGVPPPPILQWSLIVGDVVHNLASALENLVWELVQINRANWPPRPAGGKQARAWDSHWTTVGFPYTKVRRNWANNVSKYLYFAGQDHTLLTAFEEMQPFYEQEQYGRDPEHHALWVLHELWNGDKHRTINVTAAAGKFSSALMEFPDLFPDGEQFEAEVIRPYPLRPIHGKTEVAGIRARLPREIAIPDPPSTMNMKVDGQFRLGILLGDGAPATGDNVLEKLSDARRRIKRFCRGFE